MSVERTDLVHWKLFQQPQVVPATIRSWSALYVVVHFERRDLTDVNTLPHHLRAANKCWIWTPRHRLTLASILR